MAPQLPFDGVSASRGLIARVQEVAQGAAAIALPNLPGKLLGVIDLARLLDVVTVAGLPQIKTETAGAGQVVTLRWAPKIKDRLESPLERVSVSSGQPPAPALTLTSKVNRGRGLELSGASTHVEGTLSNIALVIAGAVKVSFDRLKFVSVNGQKPSFDVKVSKVEFLGDLEVVEKLAREFEGLLGTNDLAVRVDTAGIVAELRLALPTLPLGGLTISNVVFSCGVSLFFDATPAAVRFALASRKSPFLLTYTIFGGGGFFALTARTDGSLEIEAALEFGGSAEIDLLLARGSAQAMVGIYFHYKDQATVEGFVRLHGELEVLGIITISVDFYLGLAYEIGTGTVRGRAALTVMVKVLFFSQSVTLEVERSFRFDDAAVADAFGFEELAPAPEESGWLEYWGAFV
jgi:hypothetical protein